MRRLLYHGLTSAGSRAVQHARSIATSRVPSGHVQHAHDVQRSPGLNGTTGAEHKLQTNVSTVTRVAATTMPSSWGPLRVVAFRSKLGDIVALISGLGDGWRVPVRVHDACLTGEAFDSLKCDCGLQLRLALKVQTKRQLGLVIYMPQEGRGIGLANKIKAYSLQEELGLDTVDANLALGLPAEMRDYSAVPHILKDLGVRSTLLMTNNPFKVEQLRLAGVSVEGTLPAVVSPLAEATSQYLETKRRRMGHLLPEAGAPRRSPAAARPWGLDGPAANLLSDLRDDVRGHRGDRPFTLLSFAASLDGFIGGVCSRPDGSAERHPVPLSGEAAALLTQHLRGTVDAILVGVGTVQADDPRLDVRVADAGPSPRPVVLDSHLRLPLGCRLLTHHAAGGRPPVLVLCTEEAEAARADALRAAGAIVLRCRAESHGRVCLSAAWARLAEVGVRSVMVEGGAEVIGGLLADVPNGLVDRLVVTQAGVVLGDGVRWTAPGGARLGRASSFTLGEDAIFAWQLRAPTV
uniref:GTP cyclohydrolase II n=1 Tax=Alexandrium monilatum TaxID=311494 RepID=A0A7S4VUF0_9DINO|mmetsp:Transcript_4049/g.12797  ORF Transcript_4049/g.12797 Transcript_4049/m.12797 type:complete len:520 (+) Transcript_4049:230-1789(+)